MKHNALQKKITEILQEVGNGFSVVSSNKRGRPDILGHIGKIFIAVEVKVGKDTLRTAQRATLLDINRKGGIGIVVHEKHLHIFKAFVDSICIGDTSIPPALSIDEFVIDTDYSAIEL